MVTHDYTWNAAGNLAEVEVSSSTVGTYSYNASNQRTKKVAGGNTVHYVYGLNGLLYGEYDNSGSLIREYVYLNDQPLAQIDAGSPEVLTYLHTDHLGTPRYGTNSGGSQVWAANSDAFGVGTSSGSAVVNIRMAGQYYDAESGLFYNINRYYNPSFGRYISSDPIGLEGGPNTYNYANVSPVMFIDPEGLNAGLFVVGGAAIIGLVSSTSPANAPAPGDEVQPSDEVSSLARMALGATAGSGVGSVVRGTLAIGRTMSSGTTNGGYCTMIDDISGPRSITNYKTNRSSQEIGRELEKSGYNKSPTRDGGVRYEKEDKIYNFYPKSTSKGEAAIQVIKNGREISKIRPTE